MNRNDLVKFIKENKILSFMFYPIIRHHKKSLYLENQNKNRIFDKIFAMVILDHIRIRSKEFNGIFELDIRSDLFRRIALDGKYESDLIKIINKYIDPRKDAIDVGANIGLFTILFSKLLNEKSKVLSIEPTKNAFELLKRNIEINECKDKIITYNGAITDISFGKVQLDTIEGKEEYSSLGKISQNYIGLDKVTQVEVDSTNIDSLVEKLNIHPGFLKIDTEGAEFLVLKGAQKTIKKFRPIILSELCDPFLKELNHTAKDVIDLLISYNYKVIDVKKTNDSIKFPFIGEILAWPK